MENWNFGIYDSPWIGMWHGEPMTWSALNGGLVKWASNYLEFGGNHQIWPPQDLSTPALRGLEIWNDAVQQESDMNHLYKCHVQLDKIRSSHVLNTSTPISWAPGSISMRCFQVHSKEYWVPVISSINTSSKAVRIAAAGHRGRPYEFSYEPPFILGKNWSWELFD